MLTPDEIAARDIGADPYGAPREIQRAVIRRLAEEGGEAAFQRRVCDLLDRCGWSWYHTRDSRGSRAGWPDLAIWRDGCFALRELKSEAGRLTAWQDATILSLRAAGVDAAVWRPAEWPEIEAWITGGWDA